MDEHELLLRHAAKWAGDRDRDRVFDPDLLETAVRLRADLDGLTPNKWPAGSVKHLMLQRWPSHGPEGVPDVATLVGSLDSFWRFLRSTGRMGGGSADPADLRREAKAAAKSMPKACADTGNFGSAKSMLAFGREIGISLDDAADSDVVNDRLQVSCQ